MPKGIWSRIPIMQKINAETHSTLEFTTKLGTWKSSDNLVVLQPTISEEFATDYE